MLSVFYLPSQCIPFLQLETSLLSKKLTSAPPTPTQALYGFPVPRIRTSLVPEDPSVLSTHTQPTHSHKTHRAPSHC